MNPILLQKQMRENATDVNEFYNELKMWGSDMRKEHSLPNLNNTEPMFSDKLADKTNCSFPKKHAACTVRGKVRKWDKFDVNAEGDKVDYNEDKDSDLTDEYDDVVRDEAYVQKEQGNILVKSKKWDEAIECYNKAIYCYSYDPVFYANRALCFLKKQNDIKAELDCTMAIRLDSTYVKAFHRRAIARERLGKLCEAEADFLKVLEIEPSNLETSSNLDALRKKISSNKQSDVIGRPVSKFLASRNKIVQNSIQFGQWHEADDMILVKAVVKPTYLQCKKSLRRMEIQEIVGCIETHLANTQQSVLGKRVFDINNSEVAECQLEAMQTHHTLKENKNCANETSMTQTHVNGPMNSIQFYLEWKQLKTQEQKYSYMKLMNHNIFKGFLENNVFSEIIEILVNHYIKNNDKMLNWLNFLSEIKRFSTLILFMTDADKCYLRRVIAYLQQRGDITGDQLKVFIKKFEL